MRWRRSFVVAGEQSLFWSPRLTHWWRDSQREGTGGALRPPMVVSIHLGSGGSLAGTEKLTAWLGNSERIAEKHSLQVLDSHFDRASAPNSAAPALRNMSETLMHSPTTVQRGKCKTPCPVGKTNKTRGLCERFDGRYWIRCWWGC